MLGAEFTATLGVVRSGFSDEVPSFMVYLANVTGSTLGSDDLIQTKKKPSIKITTVSQKELNYSALRSACSKIVSLGAGGVAFDSSKPVSFPFVPCKWSVLMPLRISPRVMALMITLRSFIGPSILRVLRLSFGKDTKVVLEESSLIKDHNLHDCWYESL